jgi:hypothetical protein
MKVEEKPMSHPFLEFVARDQVVTVAHAIEAAVEESFVADSSRRTGDEIRRRLAICERLIRHLRADLGWGLQRVLDHLPHYLRCDLDGEPWEPDKRTIWMPQDGA